MTVSTCLKSGPRKQPNRTSRLQVSTSLPSGHVQLLLAIFFKSLLAVVQHSRHEADCSVQVALTANGLVQAVNNFEDAPGSTAVSSSASSQRRNSLGRLSWP